MGRREARAQIHWKMKMRQLNILRTFAFFLVLCCLCLLTVVVSQEAADERVDGEQQGQGQQSTSATNVVNFVWSYASLLSGGVYDCSNIEDPTCYGGIAVFFALLRKYNDNGLEPSLFVPRIDYQSAFVQMHPLEWGINRFVLKEMYNIDSYFVYRSFMTQHKTDTPNSQRDLSSLHTQEIRPLVGNFVLHTSNSWFEYIEHIHFDYQTGLAVIPVDEGDEGTADETLASGVVQRVEQVKSTEGLLTYIYNLNVRNGCIPSTVTDYQVYVADQRGQGFSPSLSFNRTNGTPTSSSSNSDSNSKKPCWLPIIVYEEFNTNSWETFVDSITTFSYPPAAIVDIRNNSALYNTPQLVNNNTWIVSYENQPFRYYQNRFHIRNGSGFRPRSTRTIESMELIFVDMGNVNISEDFSNDDALVSDLLVLRQLADAAVQNDPIKGYTGRMPEIVNQVTSLRTCFGGECALGNLFTDAMRWKTQADVAFIQSGGIRGSGWPAGPVRVSDIWEALPFANTLCEGTISGIGLFRIFETATKVAPFLSTWNRDGDNAFQVSGMRYTYNTQIMNSTRLVGIDIWNDKLQKYEPIVRLKMYRFVTMSWECYGFDPYPSFLGEEYLVIKGEKPGVISDDLVQNVVGEYLESLENVTYDTSLQGRLVNDTNAWEPLVLIQSQETCPAKTYWLEEFQTCFDCPETDQVVFTEESREMAKGFEGIARADFNHYGNAEIINQEEFPVTLFLKLKPDWVQLTSPDDVESAKIVLNAGDNLEISYTVNTLSLDDGTAQGAISFGVVDGGFYPGCEGRDTSFEIFMVVTPPPELLRPGIIRFVGLGFMGLAILTTMSFAVFVYLNRGKQIIRQMQPFFLLVLCGGVIIISLAIIPMSIKDYLRDERGRDMACMAWPWLIILGFTVVITTLFAKLWRINKIFNRQMKRVSISVKSGTLVISAFSVLNVMLLLIWTLKDPLKWAVKDVPGEDYLKYATCMQDGLTGWIMLSLILVVNFVSLILALHQAFKARKISTQFSEAKALGLALFGWIQIMVVGIPVIFLLKGDNANAKYFLQVVLIIAICMSMILFIFVPITMHLRQYKGKRRPSSVCISGLQLDELAVAPQSFYQKSIEVSAPASNMLDAASGMSFVAKGYPSSDENSCLAIKASNGSSNNATECRTSEDANNSFQQCMPEPVSTVSENIEFENDTQDDHAAIGIEEEDKKHQKTPCDDHDAKFSGNLFRDCWKEEQAKVDV